MKPDLSTFSGRLLHFRKLTNPANFFKSDRQIWEEYETIKQYEQKLSESKAIEVSPKQKEDIVNSYYLTCGAIKDNGEMIPKMGRMSGFLAANLPITFGLLMAPPTMFNTIFIQWVNQSYMAGLNYANKNASCKFTT